MTDDARPPHVPSVFIDVAATRLGVSRRTVYNRIRAGFLETVYVHHTQRVTLESIERELVTHRVPRRRPRAKAVRS